MNQTLNWGGGAQIWAFNESNIKLGGGGGLKYRQSMNQTFNGGGGGGVTLVMLSREPWHLGNHLIELGKRFSMNTNMTGFR